jgi:NADH-quinone oxidoreductase subunit F
MALQRAHVLVCAGAGCVSSGCKAVEESLIQSVKKLGLADEVRIIETGCMGPCDMGPAIVVYPEGVFYRKLKPEDAPIIVEEHLLKGRVVERLLYRAAGTEETLPKIDDITFFNRQERIVLRNCGLIDPLSIEEAIARDGYAALGKALSKMKPEEVAAEVKKSGLRGRGGAGFLTGQKWEFAARAAGSPKYVVCNADEGDPGAFMDRSVLEGDPHSVIEGMAICGYAIGSSQGYVYVRAEYPLAVERLTHAIGQAREYGLLGKNIMGLGFDFDLEIRVGAGAFVCGEETALMASIEGRRGEPRPRPPFPAQAGLWGKPTNINNVETWASISPIILRGADWFAGIGTEKSKGTKVFALAGKIRNTGLVEVPMGMPLGEIIFDLGGGIPDGKVFKAAQTGGPSGGCIPKEYLNTRVDYETLAQLGTIMGSGGLIVMDEDTCMVDLAKFFIEFVQDESCGKCAPCRIGTKRMLEILERITHGEGKEGDVELLIDLGEQIKASALCGLGQTGPNPVLSTIRYFRHEYDQHIRDKKCLASVCASLFLAPCQNSCPADVDVPLYVDLTRQGRFGEAHAVIRMDNPLPMVCGRVCNHPCERKCRRGQLDTAINIRALKRFVAEYPLEGNGATFQLPAPAAAKVEKVAIVGSGPSGLTAANYLARKGYQVTVYEALPVLGGMLAVGIPEYRLPKKALKKEIELLEKLGVRFKTKIKIGRDVSLTDLRAKSDAVYVAIGAQQGQKLGIPGEDAEGVLDAVSFLRDINLGQAKDLKGKTVLVIGGGNAAVDAARSSLRLGAKKVTIVYRRSKAEMPALEEEIEEAEREGIEIRTLLAPKRIVAKGGKVAGLECLECTLGEFDPSGRRRPVPKNGSEFTLNADVVVAGVGQAIALDGMVDKTGIEVDKRGAIAACDKTGATKMDGVFAGGDCVTGPDTVIAAIAAGKRAATAIDKYLGGDGVLLRKPEIARKLTADIIEDEMPREAVPCVPVEKRLGDFTEVELGYAAGQAKVEASRCLRCDVRE